MKIKKPKAYKMGSVDFQDIANGNIFREYTTLFSGKVSDLYMKLDENTSGYNAAKIKNGELVTFMPDVTCISVDGTFVVDCDDAVNKSGGTVKTITLKEACQILDSASAVVIDDDVVTYPVVSELTGDDENEFLFLSWMDDGGSEYSLSFNEGLNREVKVSGSSIFLLCESDDPNDDESETQITILTTKELENK